MALMSILFNGNLLVELVAERIGDPQQRRDGSDGAIERDRPSPRGARRVAQGPRRRVDTLERGRKRTTPNR
jgi:hypothetical protein